MRVRLISTQQEGEYIIQSLDIGQDYEVIGIEADWYRIIDNADEPILFDPQCFEIVDPSIPPFWRCEVGEEGERYCYPENWGRPGFFEGYFDDVPAIREQFWSDYYRLYGNDAK